MAGISSMLEPEKKAPAPRPTPAEPTHWVYLWCKRVGVEDVASNFADNEMTSREDVFAEPALTRNDLEAIGIKKLGMQRRVLRLIEIERGLSHDGDEQVSTRSPKRAAMLSPKSVAMEEDGELAIVLSLN